MPSLPPEQLQKLLEAAQALPLERRSVMLDQIRRQDPQAAQMLEQKLHEQSTEHLEVDSSLPSAQKNLGPEDRSPPDLSSLPDHTPATMGGVDPFIENQQPAEGALWLYHFGSCEIEEEIAAGGMGKILRARDTQFNRSLAVKVMWRQGNRHAELVDRFLEEARLTGQLQHPGIPPVHSVGQTSDGLPFFTMKLIKGRTLSDLLRQRELRKREEPTAGADLPRFLAIFEQICQTMAYAHSRGIIHRDLKPSNVMVGAFGEVQVMDWGLAKVLQTPLSDQREAQKLLGPGFDESSTIYSLRGAQANDLTRAGTTIGTPAFMAPEQARGEIHELDERCDVFGLGAILCVILTGHPPYRAKSTTDTLALAKLARLDDAYQRLEECGADEELIDLARRCLAVERIDRPENAAVVAQAMAAYESGLQDRLRQAELDRAQAEVEATEASKRRRVTMALAASVTMLVIIAAAAWVWIADQQAQRVAERALQRATQQAKIQQREREAQQALSDAMKLHQQADQGKQYELWAASQSAAQRARALLREVPQESPLHAKVESLLAQLGLEEKDRKMLEALDHARLELINLSGKFRLNKHGMHQAYLKAFREYGADVIALSQDQAVARLQGRSIQQELATALVFWAVTQDQSVETKQKLVGIAKALDSDPWRNELRALVLRKDQGRAKLTELAQQADIGNMSPTDIQLLASALKDAGAMNEALALVRKAVYHHPADFWIRFKVIELLVFTKNWRSDTAEIVQHLDAAVALRPHNPLIQILYGFVLKEMGLSNEAWVLARKAKSLTSGDSLPSELEAFRSALMSPTEDPKKWIAQFGPQLKSLDPELAKMLQDYLSGKLSESNFSLEFAHEFNRRFPKSPLGYLVLGRVLYNQGKAQASIPHLEKAIQLSPLSAEAHAFLGAAYNSLGKFIEAIPHSQMAVRLKTDYAWAHQNLGSSFRQANRLDEAEQSLETALDQNPENYWPLTELGMVYMQQGRLDEGEQTLRKALQLKPDYLYARKYLSGVLHIQGKSNESVAVMQKGVQLAPENPDALVGLGIAYSLSQQWQRAEEVLQQAIGLQPEYALAYYNLAQAQVSAGKLAQAVTSYRRATVLDPNMTLAHYYLAGVLKMQGELDQAITAYEQAQKLQPDHVQVQWELFSTRYQNSLVTPQNARQVFDVALEAWNLGFLRDSVNAYKTVIQQQPEDPKGYFNMGLALGDLGHPAKAENYLRQAMKRRYSRAYFSLARCLLQQGKIAQARKVHDQAVGPNGVSDAEQKERLSGNLKVLDRMQTAARHLEHLQQMAKIPSAQSSLQLSAYDLLQAATLAAFQDQFGRAAELFAQVFEKDDSLAGQSSLLPTSYGSETNRFLAACTAARAGCGVGSDADQFEDQHRERFRLQAKNWLENELNVQLDQMRHSTAAERTKIQQRLRIWLDHEFLDCVRSPANLKKLPDQEQADWRDLWSRMVEAASTTPNMNYRFDAAAMGYLANVYIKYGLIKKAGQVVVKMAKQTGGNNAQVINQIIHVAISQDKVKEAVLLLTKALQSKSAAPQHRLVLANLLDQQGKSEEARSAFVECLKQQPFNAALHMQLAAVLSRLEKRDEAISTMRSALQISPDSPSIQSQLLTMLHHAAWPLAAQGAVRNPQDAQTTLRLAAELDRQGYLQNALELYQGVAQTQTISGEAAKQRGELLWRLGRSKEAIPIFEELSGQSPMAEVYHQLGSSYLADGRLQHALAAFEKAAQLAGENQTAKQRAADAIKTCNRLVRLTPLLDEYIQGKKTGSSEDERFDLCVAALLAGKRRQSAQWSKQLFEHHPAAMKRTFELYGQTEHWRFWAACAAAGETSQTDSEAAPWRKQALTWLSDELNDYKQQLPSSASKKRAAIQSRLRLWLAQPSLASVRLAPWAASGHARRLDDLPKTEKNAWRKFWRQVVEASQLPKTGPKQMPATDRIALALAFHRFGFHDAALNTLEQVAVLGHMDSLSDYNAACAAALMADSTIPPPPSAPLTPKQKEHLRNRALDWLDQNLTTLEENSQLRRITKLFTQFTLRHWRHDDDLASLRDPSAIDQLPQGQQQRCRNLWSKVDAFSKKLTQNREAQETQRIHPHTKHSLRRDD